MMSEITTLRPTINKNFLIKITPTNGKDILVGAGQYHKHVGEELCLKHFQKVLAGGLDKYTFKLRRGLRIDFVGK